MLIPFCLDGILANESICIGSFITDGYEPSRRKCHVGPVRKCFQHGIVSFAETTITIVSDQSIVFRIPQGQNRCLSNRLTLFY